MYFDYSMRLIKELWTENTVVTSGMVLASLNMILQIMLSMVFGKKGVPKIGGYRGES